MGRSSWLLAGAVNLVVGMFGYAAGFMSSYFMNDSPGRDDQLLFVKFGVAVALISAAVIAVMICSFEHRAPPRTAVFAITASIALNAAFLAVFFGSQALDLGSDPAYFYGVMTVRQVYGLAAWCAAVALIAAVGAVLATIRISRSGSRPPRAAAPSWRA